MFRIRWPHVEAERLEGLLHSTDSALTRHYGLKATGLKQQMTHGLLGMAGALTVSSLPHRTSPVLRGKWVRETLLGSTPPPPPADVPALDPKTDAARSKSSRELLETHRRNAVCASCHASIDPIGFGLENYDLLGRWRTEDAGQPNSRRCCCREQTTSSVN